MNVSGWWYRWWLWWWWWFTWTTLTAMSSEKGRVAMMRRMEIMVMRWAQMPGPSSHTGENIFSQFGILYFIFSILHFVLGFVKSVWRKYRVLVFIILNCYNYYKLVNSVFIVFLYFVSCAEIMVTMHICIYAEMYKEMQKCTRAS